MILNNSKVDTEEDVNVENATRKGSIHYRKPKYRNMFVNDSKQNDEEGNMLLDKFLDQVTDELNAKLVSHKSVEDIGARRSGTIHYRKAKYRNMFLNDSKQNDEDVATRRDLVDLKGVGTRRDLVDLKAVSIENNFKGVSMENNLKAIATENNLMNFAMKNKLEDDGQVNSLKNLLQEKGEKIKQTGKKEEVANDGLTGLERVLKRKQEEIDSISPTTKKTGRFKIKHVDNGNDDYTKESAHRKLMNVHDGDGQNSRSNVYVLKKSRNVEQTGDKRSSNMEQTSSKKSSTHQNKRHKVIDVTNDNDDDDDDDDFVPVFHKKQPGRLSQKEEAQYQGYVRNNKKAVEIITNSDGRDRRNKIPDMPNLGKIYLI